MNFFSSDSVLISNIQEKSIFVNNDFLFKDNSFSSFPKEQNIDIIDDKLNISYNHGNINNNDNQISENIDYSKFIGIIYGFKWKEETKEKFIKLFQEYNNFRKNHIILDDIPLNIIQKYNVNLSSLINCNNINYFLTIEKRYKSLNLNKYKRMFLKVFKNYYKNDNINYTYNNLGNKNKKKKIVYVSQNKLFELFYFLKNNFLYEELLILELLLKYKINIGGISKIKNNDCIKKNSLLIENKYNKNLLIKNKSIIKMFNVIIKLNQIEKNEYIFYKGIKGNIKNRINYVVKKFNRNIRKSKIFDSKKLKNLTSETFRKINFSKSFLYIIQKFYYFICDKINKKKIF